MAHGLKIKQKPHHKVIHHGSRTLRGLRKIGSIITILFIVFAIVAVIMSYISNQNSTPVNTVTIKPQAKAKSPSKPPPDAKVGVSLRYITDTVKRGENASFTIHTNPDCNCTIKVEYAAEDFDNKVEGKDSGLSPKLADEFGLASWSWTVPVDAPTGKAHATTFCKNQKNSGMYIGYIEVK